jgi:HEAT repeat protein
MISLLFLLALWAPPLLTVKPVDKAWSTLEDGVEDKSVEKRTSAVHALGVIAGSPRAQSLAEKALTDFSPEVRVEAADALAGMRATSAKPKLRDALNDRDAKVVVAAANALYTFKDPIAYQVYYAMLTGERKSTNGLVQTQLEMLRDRKSLTKIAFEAGIGFIPFAGMGWDAWKTISHDDSSIVEAAAAEKLASDSDPKSAEALVGACSDKKWRIRAAAANAIAKRGDSKLLDALIPLMLDENDNVRFEAAAAVLRLDAMKAPRKRGMRASGSGTAAR